MDWNVVISGIRLVCITAIVGMATHLIEVIIATFFGRPK